MHLGPIKPMFRTGSSLCENPLWDAAHNTLTWTDITAGVIYRWNWGEPQPVKIYNGPMVGGFTRQHDGSLLLFRENDIALLTGDHQVEGLIGFHEPGAVRFNDVIADPVGRVFAGTIGHRPESGGLYRFERDGTFLKVASGTGISNGLAFSPDLRFLYWTCSTRRRIYRFPYDRVTGDLGQEVIFLENEESEGIPDGLQVDGEGNLYSIRWAAAHHGLVVINPDGKIIHRQSLPAKTPTSVCFCGPSLHDLGITTADDGKHGKRAADILLIAGMPVAGTEEFVSRIEIEKPRGAADSAA